MQPFNLGGKMMLGQPLHLQFWLLVSIGLSDSHIVTTSVRASAYIRQNFACVGSREKSFFFFSRSDGFFLISTSPKMLNGCPFKNGG